MDIELHPPCRVKASVDYWGFDLGQRSRGAPLPMYLEVHIHLTSSVKCHQFEKRFYQSYRQLSRAFHEEDKLALLLPRVQSPHKDAVIFI